MRIIYPRIINSSFIQNNENCDFCTEQSTRICKLKPNEISGWKICEKKRCFYEMSKTYKRISIKKEKIQRIMGVFFKVKRSNGKIENNWRIISDAVEEVHSGEYWINVEKENTTKEVRLRDLQKWNKNKN